MAHKVTNAVNEAKQFTVHVLVYRRKRSWGFSAYTSYYDAYSDQSNIVRLTATTGLEAQRKAIAIIKARMDLTSQIAPSSVRITEEIEL